MTEPARKHWSFYGFVYVGAIPISVLSANIIWNSQGIPFTPFAIASLYPLGLLWFALSPRAFRPSSSYESPQAHIEFSKGARYALFTIFGVSLPSGLAMGIIFHEYLIGTGLMFVALGSLVLSEASIAATYGYLIAKDEGVADFFSKASRYPLSRGMLVIFWLALFLRNRSVLKRLSVGVDFVVFLSGAYFLGWALLSLARGFPVTLFGASLGVLVPLSSFFSLRRRTTCEERHKLSEVLTSRTPKTFHISASLLTRDSHPSTADSGQRP